jgi:hypothetical protein
MMVEALTAPPTLESLRALQTGAFMLIIDAYDRKATRDQMLTAVSAAGTLLTELGKLFMIEQIFAVADIAEGVTRTQIEEARQALLKNMQHATRDALSMANLLKQCPNDEDKVN